MSKSDRADPTTHASAFPGSSSNVDLGRAATVSHATSLHKGFFGRLHARDGAKRSRNEQTNLKVRGWNPLSSLPRAVLVAATPP